jgi:thioesterase domain-containing protein
VAVEENSMTTSIEEIQQYIHDHIPITADLKTFIKYQDDNSISIGAPLAENINHRNSAFGGSMSAIGILSGWALIFIEMKKRGLINRLVIQRANFEFLHPVTDDFEAVSIFPSDKELERFIKMFIRKGKARLSIKTNILCNSKLCGINDAVYVAVKI